jgi:hypothetical protein
MNSYFIFQNSGTIMTFGLELPIIEKVSHRKSNVQRLLIVSLLIFIYFLRYCVGAEYGENRSYR